MLEILTDENFILYAAKHYDNTQCHSFDEFMDDIKRIKYIKKLVTRYLETGDLKERLILNHIIILHNVFEKTALCRMIFLKMHSMLPQIKPFFILLNTWPAKVHDVRKKCTIDTDEIALDPKIVEALRKI
jgi:hypothetical protein